LEALRQALLSRAARPRSSTASCVVSAAGQQQQPQQLQASEACGFASAAALAVAVAHLAAPESPALAAVASGGQPPLPAGPLPVSAGVWRELLLQLPSSLQQQACGSLLLLGRALLVIGSSTGGRVSSSCAGSVQGAGRAAVLEQLAPGAVAGFMQQVRRTCPNSCMHTRHRCLVPATLQLVRHLW
jgi:hypothetical protein